MCFKQARVHLLDTQPFSDAFGPKTKRKKPKLLASDYESLVQKADGSQGKKKIVYWCFSNPSMCLCLWYCDIFKSFFWVIPDILDNFWSVATDAFGEKHDASTSTEGGEDGFRDLVRHTMFDKGQSKRIWGELYKVIDSSDVIVQVDFAKLSL